MQYQQLIFFALFLTVTYATTINFFDAQAGVPFGSNTSTVYDTLIQLWADVTDCPLNSCSCEVQTDGNSYNLTFLNNINKGYVDIKNLQPDTLYSFTLTCEGADQNVTRNITTDYGRPSAPQNTTVILNSKHLRVSWLPPLLPAGPISNYSLKIDQKPVITDLPNSKLSYDMTEDYVYGTRHTFIVMACNENRHNSTVCSYPNQTEVTFFIPAITTTTTPSSTSILSISFSIPLFSFLLFSQFKY